MWVFMLAVTAKQMRKLEQITFENYQIPSLLLMEHAAKTFADALVAEYGSVKNKTIRIFCGKGNNGGDGFAAARILANYGASVYVSLVFPETTPAGDAGTNYEIIRRMGILFLPFASPITQDIVIDAIFGTGFHGELPPNTRICTENINHSTAFVAAMDVPTGMDSDTGNISKHCVHCNLCVTFGVYKIGLFLPPAINLCKKLVKTDISIPASVINDFCDGYDIADTQTINQLPTRCENGHKGTFGKALAYVGAMGFCGAAILSASAVLKSGAGMVTAAIPQKMHNAFCPAAPAVMTALLDENAESSALCEHLLTLTKDKNAFLCGCGLGRAKKTIEIVVDLYQKVKIPTVADADALFCLAAAREVLSKHVGPRILTPHIAEFARLANVSTEQIQQNRIACAQSFSEQNNVTLVLKDSVTVIATPGRKPTLIASPNSGMATAGSGDVLAGIITGLLCQGIPPHDAAVLGAYLHNRAGNLACRALSAYGMTAEDILTYLPKAFL